MAAQRHCAYLRRLKRVVIWRRWHAQIWCSFRWHRVAPTSLNDDNSRREFSAKAKVGGVRIKCTYATLALLRFTYHIFRFFFVSFFWLVCQSILKFKNIYSYSCRLCPYNSDLDRTLSFQVIARILYMTFENSSNITHNPSRPMDGLRQIIS